jgi:hypothetical protein
MFEGTTARLVGVSTGYVCPDCGLDYDTISPSDAKVAIHSYPRRYRNALAGALEDDADEGLVRRRPDASTWSALEYSVHVADLDEFFAGALRRMYDETEPTIDMWDPDERAAAERYGDADPRATLDRLDAAAASLVAVLERVDPEGWSRTGAFPFGTRTILQMARNAVHEGSHHLRDVDRVLDLARRQR